MPAQTRAQSRCRLPVALRREDLPDSVPLADASPAQQAAVTAEYCFYLYERQLQRERQPELLITLPHPLPPTPVEGGAQAGAKAAGGSRASGKAAAEVVVRIEYSGGGGGGGAGLRFWQQFAATDNHVRGWGRGCVEHEAWLVWRHPLMPTTACVAMPARVMSCC